MSETSREPVSDPAVEALNHLLRASGLDSRACNWDVVSTLESGQGSGDLGHLLLAVDPARCKGDLVDGDLPAAVRFVRTGTPLLLAVRELGDSTSEDGGAQRPELDGEWLLLHGQTGPELQATLYGPGASQRELQTTPADLARQLGIEPERMLRWLAVGALHTAGADEPSVAPTPRVRLGRLLRPDRGDLFAIVMYAIAMGVLLLTTPIAVQSLVNFVAQGGALPPLIVVTSLMFLGLVLAGVLAAIQTWIVEVLQRRLFVRTVAILAARLPRVSIEVYDRRNGPELVNRFFDVMTIQKAGSALLLDGMSILLTVIVGLVLLAFYHPLLLAFDILLLAVIALIVLGPVRRGVRSAVGESQAKYSVAEWLEELTRHPVVFRSGGVQPWILQNTDRVVRDYLDRRGRHYRVVFAQIISALSLHAVASTVLLGLGGLLVIRGSLTLGQLVAAELVVTMIVGSVAKMGKQLENFYDLMAATDKVGFLLDLPLEAQGGERHLPAVGGGSGHRGADLELCNVTAGRPGAKPLFQDVSVQVEPGTSLAVGGSSSSARSALVDLLWGLRRPQQGSVRLDGSDLRTLSLDSVRASVSLLSELEIVATSIRENVRLGRTFVSDADVRAALQQVGLLASVERLPDGLDTQLNVRGWPLSESEARCLHVARVIVDSPRLLIVSDATLPFGRHLRARVLDVLFDSDAPWTLVVASDASDVVDRSDQVLELPEGVVRQRASDSQPISA